MPGSANPPRIRQRLALAGVAISMAGVAHAAVPLVVLPLARDGSDLTAAQVKTLSEQLTAVVNEGHNAYRTRKLSATEAAAVWERLRVEFAGVDRSLEIEKLLGGKHALLYGRVGKHRVTLNLRPIDADMRRAARNVPEATGGRRLVQEYTTALQQVASSVFSDPSTHPISVYLDDTGIAGLDPHQAIRREQVIENARVALRKSFESMNQAVASGKDAGKRKLTVAIPAAIYSHRCWLHVDYKDTIIIDCERMDAAGSRLFWQTAVTDFVPWEPLVPLAAKIHDDATGRLPEQRVERIERVVFLVDNSGSLIVNDFLPYLNNEPRHSRRYRAVKRLTEALGKLEPAPEIGILVYAAGDAQRWIGWFRADNGGLRNVALADLRSSLEKISPGGTDIAAALRSVAKRSQGAAAMVLLTDGAQTVLPNGQDAITDEEQERALRYVVSVAQEQHEKGKWAIHVVNIQIGDFERLRNATRADARRVIETWSRAEFFAEDEEPDIEGFIGEINAGNHKVEELGVLAAIAGPGTYWESRSLEEDSAILEGELFGVLRLPMPRIHVLCDRQNEYELIECNVPYLKPGKNRLLVRNDYYDRICGAKIAKLSKGAWAEVAFEQSAEDAIELDVEVAVSGSAAAGSIGNVSAEIELRYVPRGGRCK